MKISQKYSLINDLEQSLITIFEDSNYEFNFNGEQLFGDEIFKSNMFLPLFLFDKQKLIYRYCSEKLGVSHAQIILQQSDDAAFGFSINVEHNVDNHNQYNSLLKFLISLVMAEPIFNQLSIDLNPKYKHWLEVLNNSLVQSTN